MILKPEIIFADEPTGNLDSENTNQIMQLFRKLNKEYSRGFHHYARSLKQLEIMEKIIKELSGMNNK